MADKEAAWLATADHYVDLLLRYHKEGRLVYVNTFQPVFGIEYTETESWVVRPTNRYSAGNPILIKTSIPRQSISVPVCRNQLPAQIFGAPTGLPHDDRGTAVRGH